jgi:anti-anti-sigma regulatory factor
MGTRDLREDHDRCPYARPFPEGFTDCPTYEAVTFIAADSNHQPLRPTITCRHLTMGNVERPGRYYPRCALGSAADRLRWRTAVGASRLDEVRHLQEEFETATRQIRERLLHAKAALVGSHFARSARAELEDLSREFLDQVEQFLAERRERYDGIGMPADALFGLIQDWTRAWARSPEVALDGVSHDPLRAWSPSVDGSDRLVIRQTATPPGLALSGEVDASNVQLLERALAVAARASEQDLHLDLSGLEFCDLGGMRAIVRAAETLGTGRRLVVHALPAVLNDALRLAGWAELPQLVVERQPALEGRPS